MRLTKSVLDQVLRLNEGYSWKTSFSSKNFADARTYFIQGGKLLVRSVSKSSWADSRRVSEWVAHGDELRRLLRSVLANLKLPG